MGYRHTCQMLKTAGLFDFLKADNNLGQRSERAAQYNDPPYQSSWDPDMIGFDGTEFAYDTTALNKTLDTTLRKHYAKLLAQAYLKSTGKKLANPESKISPRYSYMVGRAANVDPAIYNKLNQYYKDNLGGWSSVGKDVSPGLAADAVDMANQVPFVPLDKEPGESDTNPPKMTVARPLRLIQG